MDPNDDAYLGRVAYEAYVHSSRGVSLVSGQKLPSWNDQDDKIRKAWASAAHAVQKALPAPVEVDDRGEDAPEEIKLDDAHREG